MVDIPDEPLGNIPSMIQLTRLNHIPLILNSDLIEHIETTPDTIIVLTSGQKFVVTESVEEVIDKVIKYRRSIAAGLDCPLLKADPAQVKHDRVSHGR